MIFSFKRNSKVRLSYQYTYKTENFGLIAHSYSEVVCLQKSWNGILHRSKLSWQKTFVISWILFQNKYFMIKLSWSREYFMSQTPLVIHPCLVQLNTREKIFVIPFSHKNHESFLPWKFGAIWYVYKTPFCKFGHNCLLSPPASVLKSYIKIDYFIRSDMDREIFGRNSILTISVTVKWI